MGFVRDVSRTMTAASVDFAGEKGSLQRIETKLCICRDKSKFGGSNRLKQKCLQRRCLHDPRKAGCGNKRKERSCSSTPGTSSGSGSTSQDSDLDQPLLNAGQVPALLNEKKEEKRVEDGEYFELHSPKYCPPSP